MVKNSFSKKKHEGSPTWRGLLVVVSLVVLVLFFSIMPLFIQVCSTYPGEFLYTENRFIDSPEEETLLTSAETFNFTILSTTFPFFSNDTYISRTRLNSIATEAARFNPFLACGRESHTYTANVTHFTTLNLTISRWEIYPEGDPLVITSEGVVVFPYGTGIWSAIRWSATYWNGTSYVGIDQRTWSSYTDVFLIDMKLATNYSSPYESDEREFQQIIVDNTGRVVFVFWLLRHGPVA